MSRISRFFPSCFVCLFSLFLFLTHLGFPSTAHSEQIQLSDDDRALLTQIQRDTVKYFIDYADPNTGLTQDSSRGGSPASVAATGFGVASLAIAANHGWLSYKEAYERVEKAITTLEHHNSGKKGFFYHFLDPATGNRIWRSEVSSIDTALMLAGALLASTYFQGTELESKIINLYERVQWSWMLNGSELFSHGWKPEQGFLPYYWDMYSEHLILQALAAGSETNPVSKEIWQAWQRAKDDYNGKEIVYSYTGSLFTYQYSHSFIDFRKMRDQNINYFENSKRATEANREFCLAHADEFLTYREGFWGLSACLGPQGYKAYGSEPGEGLHDGTIALYAPIASIVFTPEESIKQIRKLRNFEQGKLYGTYGFTDAFNFGRNWQSSEYLGIDQGVVVLMLENFLNDETVWKRFMSLKPIERWIERTGLTEVVELKPNEEIKTAVSSPEKSQQDGGPSPQSLPQ